MPAISLGRLKQEDCEFEARLGYVEKPCLKKKREIYIYVHIKKIINGKFSQEPTTLPHSLVK
jgi:hypothetical protein